MTLMSLSLQETEIESDFDCELLSIPGYRFEYESNNVKRRVGTYIKSTIKYERCTSLEGINNHLVIIDILNGRKKKNVLSIFIYRLIRMECLKEICSQIN